jgi:molecular chaperone DnaK (HSP70)
MLLGQMYLQITRAQLESLVDLHVKRAVGPCEKALREAGAEASEVKEVILVSRGVLLGDIGGILLEVTLS